MDARKPSIMVALGLDKGHDDEGAGSDEGGDPDEAKLDAVRALFDAMKQGDEKAGADALETFFSLCDSSGASGSEGGEEA